MSEREQFIDWAQSVLVDAEVAIHNGDAAPRRALWSRNDPVTVLGAWMNAFGQQELDDLFERLADSFSACTSFELELLETEVLGDTAYTVGFEHTSVSVNGVPRTYTLRATQVYRREDGAWKVAHRHGSAPPAEPREDAMAISIFARIGTFKGESLDARHKDEIEVLSWAWGLSQSGADGHGGGGTGKVSFHDLTFTHHVDKASPSLMKACATGTHVKEATVTVRKAGEAQQDYLVITMDDVLVTSVSTSVTVEGDATIESVGLTFAKVDLEYKPQKPDGSLDTGVHFTYDLKTHEVG